MKVLYVTHYSFLYGANKSLLQLLIDLKKNYGVKAYVIIPNKGSFSKELEANEIEYIVFKFYNWLNTNSFFKRRLKRFLNEFFFRKIYKILNENENDFDIIHTNSSVTNLGGFLSKKMSTPHIWHIREYGKDDFNLHYYYKMKVVGNYFNSTSAKVIAVSKDLKDYYSLYIPSKKIKVIYNGISVKENFKKLYNYSGPLRIAIVGAISENKNQIELLKALAYLKFTRHCSNFVLYIVGDGTDEYMDFLRKYVKEQNLIDNVVFNGYISNVESFLNSIDLGIVSSKREAFGRVTVEFMINKIPVIASNTGASKEIIINNDLGFLYEYGNIKDLALKIEYFVNNRKTLEQIGENAFKYAVNNFSSSLNAKNIFEEYKKVIDIQC